jgi:hypothetical protein
MATPQSEPPKAVPLGVRFPLCLTLVALALGLAVELLFDGHPLGVSFPLWAGFAVLAAVGCAWFEAVRPSRGSVWLALPILALAAMVALRSEPLTIFLDIVIVLALLALWVRTFRSGRVIDFGWIDGALALAWTPIEACIRPWGVLGAATQRLVGEQRAKSRLFAVLRGLILALPILIVFAALLTAADQIFADYLRQAFGWLNLERLADWARRTVIVLVTGIFFLGALVTALRDPGERRLVGQDKALVRPFLGFTEAAIVLGGVDLLFAAFVAVQFGYFFGGQANITAAGYTYSEYARRGFGELVAVGILTLGLLLALAFATRREAPAQRGWYNGLSAALVVLVGVILVSAFQRLLLYEGAYGFTRLRTYTHVAILWMGVLFAVFLALLLAGQLRRFAPAVAAGAVGFALTLSLLNVDGFIVRQNAARLVVTGKIDLDYLGSLSDDAVPEMVRLAMVTTGVTQEGLLGQLACRRLELSQHTGLPDWPGAHWGRAAAERALVSIAGSLAAYRVDTSGSIWRWTSRTGGSPQPCFTPTVD